MNVSFWSLLKSELVNIILLWLNWGYNKGLFLQTSYVVLDYVFQGSRTIAPEENFPQNPNPNQEAIFFGGNCLIVPQP